MEYRNIARRCAGLSLFLGVVMLSLKDTIKSAVEHAVIRKLSSLVFTGIIAPLLPYIAVFLVILILFSMFVGAVYSAFPVGGILTAERYPSAKDREEKAKYQQLAAEYNNAEHWLVADSWPQTAGNDGQKEPMPRETHYPGRGVKKLPGLSDPENGYQYLMNWGQIYSLAFYWATTHRKAEIPDSKKKEIAEKIRPYFYYRPSLVERQRYDAEKGEWLPVERYQVYRLVEVSTIGGHYQFYYQWKTRTFELPGGDKERIVQEEVCSVQLVGDRWDRLKKVIKEVCGLKTDKDIEEARAAVWEAGEAYYREQEWLAWLLYSIDSGYLNSAGIPLALREIFMEAEQKFGIPWWFLAAVALRESSFNPYAVSPAGAIGLMQVMPANFRHYAPKLGFSYPADVYNPRAQVMVGACLLAEYMGDPSRIDWKGDGWKKDRRVVDALLKYSNYDASERLKQEALSPPHGYVYNILEYAEQFKRQQGAVWPLPVQYRTITSPFGPRVHPVTGAADFHEGIDIAAPLGTPVYSVVDGEVTFAGYAGGAGNMVTIRDSFNIYCYLHLSKIEVKKGDRVRAGQKIGEVGSTGLSSGPHLDFRVKNIMTGQWVNPLTLLGRT